MGLVLMLGLVSCGGVDSKIDRYGELAKEATAIRTEIMNGDDSNLDRLNEITAEMGKIGNELKNADLTPEQQEKLVRLSFGLD